MSLTFETGTIPDREPETDTDHMTDETPTDAPYGYKKDGTPYKRKPNGTRTATATGRTSTARVESKARQAAALLSQANELVCFGAMTVGFSATAAALATANEGFADTAYEALRQDEALCNTILKAGTTSAKVTLLIAYGMLAVNVVPVAVVEYRDKRDQRAEPVEDESYAA